MRANGYWQQGTSMIEVLVTVLLLSIGILGVIAMEMMTLKSNNTAYLRTQASVLVDDIIDRLRANPGQATTYVKAINAIPSAQNCTRPNANSSLNCSRAEMARHDLAEWVADVQATLPEGKGAIALSAGVVTVQVQWLEHADGSTSSFFASVVL